MKHINRIKYLSGMLLREDVNNSELEELIDSDRFEDTLENDLDKFMRVTIDDLDELPNKVGDKDGQLELEINEAGLGVLALGTALAAPKIADLIGKGLSEIGKRVDSNIINKMGEKLSTVGHKIHHKYENTIISVLKRTHKDRSDEFYKGAATAILLAATVALGVSSISTTFSALKAGNVGLAAIEGGLSGVKGAEILGIAKEFLPKILNNFVK